MRSIKLAATMALAFGLFAQPSTATAEELSVATFVPPNHESITVALAWFEKELAERSGGELILKVYPAGQLGAGPAQQYKRTIMCLNKKGFK